MDNVNDTLVEGHDSHHDDNDNHHDDVEGPNLPLSFGDHPPELMDTTRRRHCHLQPWQIWNRMIHEWYPIVLLLIVSVVWPWGYGAFKELLSNTDSTFHSPIPGSLTDKAQTAIDRKFPLVTPTISERSDCLRCNDDIPVRRNENTNHYNYPALLIVVHSTHKDESLLNNSVVRQYALGLGPFLIQQLIPSTTMTSQSNVSLAVVEVKSYYSYERDNLHLLAQPFMSQDDRTTLIEVVVRPNPADENNLFNPKKVLGIVMQGIDQAAVNVSNASHLQIGMTGLDYFSRDLRALTKADVRRMHVHVLPIALLLMAGTLMYQGNRGTVGSDSRPTWCWKWSQWRKLLVLMILPISGMLSTVATWSWILNALVLPHMQVTQFTPSIMMSLTLAMGMDYTLFLVGRFLTETSSVSSISSPRPLTSETENAMKAMLEQAGHVVVLSGTTLICTFLGLVTLPLPMLQSIGVGASLAILSAMFMNLLVIPSLLRTPWIQKCLVVDTISVTAAHDETTMDTSQEGLAEPLLAENEVDQDESLTHDLPTVVKDSIWMRLARQVVHPYKSIIVVLGILLILLFPVAWNSRRLDSSDISFDSLLPQNSPSFKVYEELIYVGGFSHGRLAPFRMLIDGTKSNTAMDTFQAFTLQHNLVSALIGAGGSNNSIGANFAGISVAKQSYIPFTVFQAAEMCAVTKCSNDALRCLYVVAQGLLSQDRLATIIMIELQSVSPFDREAIEWLAVIRTEIDRWMEQNPGIDVYLDGVAAVAHDAVSAVYASFPWVIGTAMFVVFGLLGFAFRSVIPPFRSIISITFTLAVSFGMAVLVYQDGIFASWNLRSLTAVDLELSWLLPVMSFSIMVGLALDYDIFLITRICEFRFLEGYNHESSIAAGLEATGGIITSAGLIMAVSFGSLLASQSPAMDQWAFVVTFSVLLDTFVIRTILVPALITWSGEKYSWYPRTPPIARVTLSGFDNHPHAAE